MKNLLLWIFFISVICSSCKKDNNLTQDDQTSELFYKSKLVKTVNLTEIKTSEISSKPNTLKLKFDSYKEMYDAFQFIENGTVFSKADVLKRTSAPIG
ncbi:hypothetical protein, partial [Pedobacter sp.]|uniref:hypothetical protein n=1 Tax=Pedobacter sp. TaxID=1411316 RepID=UPI002B8EC00F